MKSDMKALNSPETLAKIRANGKPSPYSKDWHPILDRIMDTLGITMCWSSLKSLKANKGSSGVQMFYEDRTIFLSPRAPRHYLPEWHDVCHAVVGRGHLDEPNYGMEDLPEEISDQIENDAQAAQFFLISRFHPDPKKVKRCYRAFHSTEEEFHEARERGQQILLQWVPEMREDFQ